MPAIKKIVSIREKEQPCCGGSFVKSEIIFGSGGTPLEEDVELREDGSNELREDGTNELRE